MTGAKIRVAQVATTAISIRFLLSDHIQRLLSEGFEVDAVCAPDASLPHVERQGIRVRTIPFVREPSPAEDLVALRALQKLFRERRYDIVHSHTPKAGLLAPVAARLAGTPTIIHTVHGLLFHDRSRPSERLLGAACEFWTARFAHRLLSQSREDIDVMRRLHMKRSSRVEYIGNGIDITRFRPPEDARVRARTRAELGILPDQVVVGMVGRLVREKGFVEFASAMQQVMRQHAEARVLIVGPIDEGQSDGLSPRELLAQLDPSRTTCLGHRDDLPELYAAMNIFALPSYREGVPRTLMEASSMGLPVVASNIRGCREVVRASESGLLCEPRDVPSLVDALTRLVADPKLRARFGAAGTRHIAEHFDSRVVLDRLARYYQRLASSTRERGHA